MRKFSAFVTEFARFCNNFSLACYGKGPFLSRWLAILEAASPIGPSGVRIASRAETSTGEWGYREGNPIHEYTKLLAPQSAALALAGRQRPDLHHGTVSAFSNRF